MQINIMLVTGDEPETESDGWDYTHFIRKPPPDSDDDGDETETETEQE